MTFFALTLWAWNVIGSATALALVGFFSQLPSIPITLIAELITDRSNRKRLMLLRDAIAALSTLVIGLLYLTDQLQLWHLYRIAMLNGGFGQIQLVKLPGILLTDWITFIVAVFTLIPCTIPQPESEKPPKREPFLTKTSLCG